MALLGGSPPLLSLAQGDWGSFPGQQLPLGQRTRTLQELLEGSAVCEGGFARAHKARIVLQPPRDKQQPVCTVLGWLVCVSTGSSVWHRLLVHVAFILVESF